MPFMVLMVTKPVFTAATSTALQESLAFIEKRLRLVAETLTVAGDTILGGFPNAEFAQQAAMKLLSVAGQGVGREWQIGIAAGGDNAALQASQLANAASVGEAVIALEAYSLLTAKSRARYLPAETIAGRQACRTLPRGVRRAFLVTPMGEPLSTERKHSRFIYEKLVVPACNRLVPRCVVVHPEDQAGCDVWADIANTLFSTDHVLAYPGFPPWNPNVMVEVGYRLATGKPRDLGSPRPLVRSCEPPDGDAAGGSDRDERRRHRGGNDQDPSAHD